MIFSVLMSSGVQSDLLVVYGVVLYNLSFLKVDIDSLHDCCLLQRDHNTLVESFNVWRAFFISLMSFFLWNICSILFNLLDLSLFHCLVELSQKNRSSNIFDRLFLLVVLNFNYIWLCCLTSEKDWMSWAS